MAKLKLKTPTLAPSMVKFLQDYREEWFHCREAHRWDSQDDTYRPQYVPVWLDEPRGIYIFEEENYCKRCGLKRTKTYDDELNRIGHPAYDYPDGYLSPGMPISQRDLRAYWMILSIQGEQQEKLRLRRTRLA